MKFEARKYTLAIAIFVMTGLLVLLGYSFGDKLKVVYMSSGSALGHNAPAGSAAAALQNLFANIQRRDFDSAYQYLSNPQDVDRGEFEREVTGADGSLRNFSALHDFQIQQLSVSGTEAKMRANLQWTTAVGAFYTARDFKVIYGRNGWKVEWVSERQPKVPPQVVAVTYPRWDIIRPGSTSADWDSPQQNPKIKVLSQKLVQDADNVLVVGEIQNADTVPAFVEVSAAISSNNGEQLGGETSFDNVKHTLMPNEKSPFRIDFPATNAGRVSKVNVRVSSTLVPASADPVIAVQDAHIDSPQSGQKILKGNLLNQSGETVNIPQVIAAYYDRAGNVVWVTDTYLDHVLLPQTPLAFAMGIPEEVADKVHSFEIVVNTYRINEL